MKKILTLLLLLIMTVMNGMADGDNVYVQYINNSDGLPNNTVRSIFQDSKGFIWMSTLNGLCRYDGYSFKVYMPQAGNDISLSDRRTKSIREDGNGFLWLSTSSDQICCFDLRHNRFVDFTGCGEYKQNYSYYAIFPDAVWLWGKHNGARRVVWRNGRFNSQSFSTANGQLKSDHVSFAARGHDGQVWIGTRKGLYRYSGGRMVCADARRDYNMMLILPGGRTGFLGSRNAMVWDGRRLTVMADLQDVARGGQISGTMVTAGRWMVFTQNGTASIDLKTRKVEHETGLFGLTGAETITDAKGYVWVYDRKGALLVVTPKTGAVKTLHVTAPEQARLVNNLRYNVAYDRKGTAWIASNVSGLFSYNHATGQLVHHDENDGRYPLVTSNVIQSLFIDRAGGFWIGSENSGVSHFFFSDNPSYNFYVANEGPYDDVANSIRITQPVGGSVFLSTRNGMLYEYDASLSRLLASETFDKNVYAVCRDARGVLWKGTRGSGLYIGDRHYTHNDNDPQSLAHNQVFCLTRDRRGRMWIGMLGGGLDLAVPDGRGGYRFRHFLNRSYAQSSVRTLLTDRNGWIWAGTSDGIFIFDPDKYVRDGLSYHYLPNAEVKQIKEDRHGNIYFSEAGVGFFVCTDRKNYARMRLERFGAESGLINTTVQAFAEDNRGRMWMTTENGVSCFNPQKKTFDNYIFSNDSKRNVYNECAAFMLPDGRLAFGTNFGLQIINPRQLKDHGMLTKVVVTGLKINGVEDSRQDKSLAYADAVKLDYNQNSFVVNFSTLDFPVTRLPQYSYMLENYDKDWSVPATLNFAAYKNLAPGTYKLRIKVRNDGGQWSKETTLVIVVTPPFWRTTWAYIVYALLLGAAAYTAFSVMRRMNALRNRVKIEKELTDYKLVFFTNISHEFRTPLTLIQGALERFRRMNLPPEGAATVKMMAKSTGRMMRLVNQLIDFRKMEKGRLQPALEKADIIAFVRDICRNFNEQAAGRNIRFACKPDVKTFEMYIDKEKLDKIVYNLLSNAFKYTPEGGKITCSIHTGTDTAGNVTIAVADTGVGIPEEKQKELFGRFMQSSFSRNSMGIGLHLTKELVGVLKGTIAYHDNPGGGSVFTVTLPADEKLFDSKAFLSAGSVLLKEEEQRQNSIDGIAAGDTTAEPEETMTESATPLNRRHLLVIEDDDDVRAMLRDELSHYFEVATASNGKTGIDYAMENDVDLIVCDVMMPGMSGFEVTGRLKTDFQTSHIPVILLTALGDADNYLEGIKSGADAYVTKPFSIRLLLARISNLIEQRDKLKEKFSKDPVSMRPVICTNNEDKTFSDKLLQIIEKHLKDADFSADDFAAEMALGRTVFYKKVKGVTGYSPKEYIRIMRMKKAAALLLNPDVTVSEVAYGIGMNNPLYFSRCFKQQFGVSPSTYQKNGGVITGETEEEDEATAPGEEA